MDFCNDLMVLDTGTIHLNEADRIGALNSKDLFTTAS